jgi:hypothetical protein
MSVELDFPNCYATLDVTATNFKTMTVAWKPYAGAASYKVFFSDKTSIVHSPINANPTELLVGSSYTGTLISEQTNAILGTSTTYTFTNSSQKKVVYVYAYSDSSATIRLTNFPTTVITAQNGSGGLYNKIYYDYTEYSPLDAYGRSIELAAFDAVTNAFIAANAAGEDTYAAIDASWAESVADAATQGVILNPSPRSFVTRKYVDTTITSPTGDTRNISSKPFTEIPAIELDFPNCYATLDGQNIKTMTVAWKPYAGASSYKVFFSNKSDIVEPPYNGDPTQVLAFSSYAGPLITEQTNAILGTSTLYTFTTSSLKQIAYVYAYSDSSASVRLTRFPSTLIVAQNTASSYSGYDQQSKKLFYQYSTYVYNNNTISFNPSIILNSPFEGNKIIISSKPFTPAATPVCFFGDAPVLTPSGYRRMDSLAVGDIVSTPQGTAPIKAIVKKFYEASSSTNPYLIPKGLFGATQDLEISPRHKVSFKGEMVEARKLGLKKIKHVGTLTYYNLELDDNMIVAGVEVESLQPLTKITISREAFDYILHTQYGGKITDEIKSKCQLLPDGRVSVPSIKH